MKDRALQIAVTKQRGEPLMYGKGMETNLSLNWIVLLHLTSRSAPHEENWKELSVNCLSGLKISCRSRQEVQFPK